MKYNTFLFFFPFDLITIPSFPHSRLKTGFLTRVTRPTSVTRNWLTPEARELTPECRVAQPLVFHMVCLSLCPFSLGHSIVCPSSNYCL